MNIILEPITSFDYNNIKKLTGNIDNMKYVYQSKVWTHENIIKFINNCKYNDSLADDVRNVYSYRITMVTPTKRYFCGIIEFKTVKYYSKFKIYEFIKNKLRTSCILTILIAPEYQNKGLFPILIDLIKQKIRLHKPKAKFLASLVMKSNTKMLHVMDKYKFKLYGYVPGYKETNAIYKIEI